ncbi:MAG TPA: hypothetical protein VM510_02125, partial [Caulifigura sp.]|nr:hypothetical protein [Caulifigura sp.]
EPLDSRRLRANLVIGGFPAWAEMQWVGSQIEIGETVLAIEAAAADAPRQRRAEDPWIEISSLKAIPGPTEQDKLLQMELRIVQGKPERFSIVLKSSWGRSVSAVQDKYVSHPSILFRSRVSPRSDIRPSADGAMQLDLPHVGDRVEAWIEYEPGPSSRPQGLGTTQQAGIKISRSVTLGPVGQLTYARTWTKAENEAAERVRLENATPPPPPDGYLTITELTASLVPGMPLMIVDEGQWKASELLAIGPRNKLVVKKAKGSQPAASLIDRGRCAVASQVLKQAEADPAQFKPSVRVFPETGGILSSNFELVGPSMTLVQGMVVQSAQHGECTFAGVAADGKLNVRTQYSQGRLQSISRSAAAIKTSDAAKLSDPEFAAAAQQRYREYLRLHDREADLRDETNDVQKKLQEFRPTGNRPKPVTAIPGAIALTTTETVPAQLPVLYHEGSRWAVATVLEDSPEGRVDIRMVWPYPGQEERAARKRLFVKQEAGDGAADRRQMVNDATQRSYTFTVEAEMPQYEVRSILTKELGVNSADPALREQPFKMEVKALKTPLEARMIEYRLLATGASVSVQEEPGVSK